MSRTAAATIDTAGLLGAPEAEFSRLAAAFRAELAARDLQEMLQVDLILMALAMLRRAMALPGLASLEVKATRAHAHAHKMLTQALREYNRLRKRALAAPAATAPAQAQAPPAAPPAPPAPAAAKAEDRTPRTVPAPVPAPMAARPRPLGRDDLFALDSGGVTVLDLAVGKRRAACD